jgi:hypothetical protein
MPQLIENMQKIIARMSTITSEILEKVLLLIIVLSYPTRIEFSDFLSKTFYNKVLNLLSNFLNSFNKFPASILFFY